MIVFDADFVGVSVLPSEHDPVLLVHPDAVACGLIALQPLKAVSRRSGEVIQPPGGVDPHEGSLHTYTVWLLWMEWSKHNSTIAVYSQLV
jgi:hypothetical protein